MTRWIPADLIESALREHWITSVNCDKSAKTNHATCSCSLWRGPVRQSVGEAVQDWVAHVLAEGMNYVAPRASQPEPPK